ncbi:MAG: hypothetical protein ACPF8V_00075 [Luteibaculum sp.]
MRFLLAALGFLCVLACQNNTQSDEIKNRQPFQGEYLLQLDQPDEGQDSLEMAAKFILSLMGPLKVKITFQENGYAKLSGNYGLLNFNDMDAELDSMAYRVEENRLYLENIEANHQEFFEYSTLDSGKIRIEADEMRFTLVPSNLQ